VGNECFWNPRCMAVLSVACPLLLLYLIYFHPPFFFLFSYRILTRRNPRKGVSLAEASKVGVS